jgi:hypothetical protein
VYILLNIFKLIYRTVISFLNCSRTLWSHSDSFQSEVESLRLRWQVVLNKLTTQRERYVYLCSKSISLFYPNGQILERKCYFYLFG